MLSRVRVLIGAIAFATPVCMVAAQAAIVDAGQFIITRNGQQVGTESFTIARTAGNATQLRATAVHREGDKVTVDTLVTDAVGSPSSYSYARTGGSAPTVMLGASRVGNRLTVTSHSGGDASTKELLVSDGMVLLDPAVYSQFYFLFLAQSGGRAPPTLVTPLTWTRTSGTVVGTGPGDVQIGANRVPTTHFTFGDIEFWVGHDHQIVKIEIPSQHIVVTREQPPPR